MGRPALVGVRGFWRVAPLRRLLVVALVLLGGLAGCSLPGSAAPTATTPPTATGVPATVAATATVAQVAVATPSVAPSPPAATATIAATATATVRPTLPASPTMRPGTPGTPGTPVPVGGTPVAVPLVLRDAQRACELPLPPGFDQNASSSPGDSYISQDGGSRIVLQSLIIEEGETLDDQALPFVGAFIPTVEGYEQTVVIRLADSLRIDFRGQMGAPGSGAIYFRQFGATLCVVTLFAADTSGINVDTLLETLIADLRPKGVG